ncbi:glutathione gamma-glutamylcysteinyltransferase [Aureococcus anophagefferens]|nr:glutathione gamma-glutamylcysteinyltransferase [Aureococcus anophagefferens]
MAIDEALQVRDALSQSTASGDAIVAVYKDAVASLEARVAGAAPAAAAKRRKPKKPRNVWGAHPPMVWFCDRRPARFASARRVVVAGRSGAIVRETEDLASAVVVVLPRGVEASAVGSAVVGRRRLELSAPVAGWASRKVLRDCGASDGPRTTVWRPGGDDVSDGETPGEEAPWVAGRDFFEIGDADGGAAVYGLSRRVFDGRRTPRHEAVAGVPGAVFARGVLSAAECRRLAAACSAMGFEGDAGVGARVFAADERAVDELSARLASVLPATVDGGAYRGVSALLRAYRYRGGGSMRAHYDDASPLRSLDGGALVDGDATSKLSVLLYVAAPPPPPDGALPGGATRFHAPAGAVAVPAARGAALCFPHAGAASPLHEGMPLDPGTEKLVLRADACYSGSMPEFYKRPLPDSCVAFDSKEGRAHFESALSSGGLENFFVLAPQFQTQNEPAFCGLATLAMALNALQVDPGRVWKGVWRWYDESLLSCCKPLVDVEREGIVLEEFVCLARCNGLEAALARPDAGGFPVAAFRDAVADACARTDVVLAASYSRKTLGQTGDGHFSCVGGYDRASDAVLLLDVARFKYPPHWVPLPLLLDAMGRPDAATGRPRGWIRLTRAAEAWDCPGCERTKAATILDRVTAGEAAKHTGLSAGAPRAERRRRSAAPPPCRLIVAWRARRGGPLKCRLRWPWAGASSASSRRRCHNGTSRGGRSDLDASRDVRVRRGASSTLAEKVSPAAGGSLENRRRPRGAKGDPAYDLLSVALRHEKSGMAPPLFGTSADARFWLCLDCCGLSCACASQAIILSSMYAVSGDMAAHGGGGYKPPRAHHDSVTNRCIVKMDHYCPWTNNAIGVRNHKFFILFILYTFLLCAYALLILFSLAMEAGGPAGFELAKLSTIAVTFAALLFGLFTACMLGDQWSVLRTNVAKIDRLKGEETECASDVNEVFGGRSRGFRADWLVPTKPLFPPSVHDEVMGYHVANGLDDDLEGGATGENGLGLEDDVRALHADEKVELVLDDHMPTSATKSAADEVRSRAKPTVV